MIQATGPLRARQTRRYAPAAAPSRPAAMLRQLCPRCCRGQVFSGLLTMHERCPECDLQYGREPGYFTGAMYVSYALAIPILAALALLFWGLTSWEAELNLLAATAVFLLFVPAIFRYSRITWMYLDRALGGE